MLPLHGLPIIDWVYTRASQSTKISKVVVAIPDCKNDDVLANHLVAIGADIFRGSETDVVDRLLKAAMSTSADIIIRVCADNPFVCASEIDRLISYYQSHECDYAYNHVPKNNNYPDGLGAEICSMQLLKEIHSKTAAPSHREHLFNFIWDHSSLYRIATFEPPDDIAYPNLKLDVDTNDDYQQLISRPYDIAMSAQKIVQTALGI